jgi:hypothetical protein
MSEPLPLLAKALRHAKSDIVRLQVDDANGNFGDAIQVALSEAHSFHVRWCHFACDLS